MKLIKQIESKKIGCRKYTMGVFMCDCGKSVIRIKRHGLNAKFCSHECYAGNRDKRGAYNPDKKIINKKYVYCYAPEHPNAIGTRKLYVAEHRLVMENEIGRYLTKDEVVHHKDEDTMNNEPSNLQIMTPSEHSKLHHKLRKCKEN